MGNFFTDVIQRDPRYRAVPSIKDVELLEPGFRRKLDDLLADAKAQGTELVITETFRSSERQQRLFAEGRTRLRKVGVHHYGLAADTVKRVGGYGGDWGFMAPLIARHGLYPSGLAGDFNHVQGVSREEQRALFAGTWYPGATIGVGTAAPLPVLAAPKPASAAIPAGLTEAQIAILAIADQINADYFNNWFWRSSVMAFCEVESDFDVRAIRREPSGVTSYGVMQVLDSTADWLGMTGPPEQLYDPLYGLFYGMKYAAWGWNYLTTAFGRPPTLDEWSDGYNAGYGAAAKGRDVPYSDKWIPARERWAAIVDAA